MNQDLIDAVVYVECPERYTENLLPTMFLAGGITGCPRWHDTAGALVMGKPVVILNPNRKHFPIEDPSAADEQVRWEFEHLQRSTVILFWFPDSGPVPQPIALYELGRYAALGRRIAVGADPGYCRRADVLLQMELGRPDVTVRATLEETVQDALRLLNLTDEAGTA